MTKKITDLEGRLDAAFDRADKTTEDSLARLCEKQRLKIAEYKEQRDELLEALRNTAFPFHQMAQGHFGNFDDCQSPVCAGSRAAMQKASGRK